MNFFLLVVTYHSRLTIITCRMYLIHSRPFEDQTYVTLLFLLPFASIYFFIYSNRMVSKCSCYLIKQMSSSFAFSLSHLVSSSSTHILSLRASISPIVECLSLLNFSSGSKV